MYKRGKGPLGAFHSSDIPEFYGSGVSPDFIGTDALGMFSKHFLLSMLYDLWFLLLFNAVNFANTGNPAIPHNSKSLLSNVDWRPWNSSSQHPLLTFLDPAPNVSITFDTFRVDAMNLLNNITLELAS